MDIIIQGAGVEAFAENSILKIFGLNRMLFVSMMSTTP